MPTSFLRLLLQFDLSLSPCISWVTFNSYSSLTLSSTHIHLPSLSISPRIPFRLQVCFCLTLSSDYWRKRAAFCKQVLSPGYLQVTVPSILYLLTTSQLCLLHHSASTSCPPSNSINSSKLSTTLITPWEAFVPKGTCGLPTIKSWILGFCLCIIMVYSLWQAK